jgi:carboxy-terminal domain RNA polymerase II polypeptide A small phosphatase
MPAEQTEQSDELLTQNENPAADDAPYQPSSIHTQDIIASCQETPKFPPPAYKSTWKAKLQSFLCCFAPAATHPYFRTRGPDTLATLPIASDQPVPHRLYTEALIGPKRPEDADKKTLVLDLDETLVHSSFKPLPNPDFIIPIDIDGKTVDVYVLKRPGLDEFMAAVGPVFEVVVFTASLSKYADPLLDLLDPDGLVRWRLFRDACCPWQGNYVKDLNCLGRDLAETIIVDNSPYSYVFQPFNAVPIGTFIDDMEDQELAAITPTLLRLRTASDVREYITQNVIHRSNSYSKQVAQ